MGYSFTFTLTATSMVSREPKCYLGTSLILIIVFKFIWIGRGVVEIIPKKTFLSVPLTFQNTSHINFFKFVCFQTENGERINSGHCLQLCYAV